MPYRNSQLPGTFVCLPAHILQKHGLQNLVCQPKRAPTCDAVLSFIACFMGEKAKCFCWLGPTSLHCFCRLCCKTLEEALQPSAPATGVASSHIFHSSSPKPWGYGSCGSKVTDSVWLVSSPMITFETKHNRMPHALNQLTWPECVCLVTEIASLAEGAPGSPATWPPHKFKSFYLALHCPHIACCTRGQHQPFQNPGFSVLFF